MSVVIKIIGLAIGAPSDFDGQYVQRYDPEFVEVDGSYDGGILETCHDRENALQFVGVAEAMECWRKSYGFRPDGEPSRPLTAFTVEIC